MSNRRPLISDAAWEKHRKVIAKAIKWHREYHGMKHREVAQAVGRTPQTIMRWCSGQETPQLRELLCLCQLFECTIWDFLP